MMSFRIEAAGARMRWPEALVRAETEPVRIVHTGDGPDLVLVHAEAFEPLLAAMEDAQDIAAAEASGMDFVPWDQVRLDLGLT